MKDRWLAALLGGVALAAYVWAAPDDIVDGDNAEFASLAQLGGAAHPTGYPLYVLWLRALSWLPGTTPAHTAAIATAILGAAAVVAIFLACRAWGARPAAAAIAAAVFAAAPVVLRVHSKAEVFALDDLIVALVLWLAAPGSPLRGQRRVIALALLAGLGLCDHVTCVLVAPVGILGVVRGLGEATRPRMVVAAAALGALALGLLPYLYIALAPETPASWGAGDVIGRFLRRDYGGLGSFGPNATPVDVFANLLALARSLARGWLVLPLVAGLVVLVVRCVRGEQHWAWRLLAASWLLAGPLLAARFNVAPEGVGRLVCERFHVLPLLLLAIPVALACDALLARLPRLARVELAAPALLVALVLLALPRQRAIESAAVEDDIVNVLRSLPEGAIVLHASDEWHFGAIYAQQVLGIRPDVAMVTWSMGGFPWYREQLARAGIDISHPPGPEPPSVVVTQRLLDTGRPVFVDILIGNVLATFPAYPYGPVYRVLPRGSMAPPVDMVVAINQRLYAAFELADRPGPDDGYATLVHLRYAHTWQLLSRALADDGRVTDAQDADAKASALAPR